LDCLADLLFPGVQVDLARNIQTKVAKRSCQQVEDTLCIVAVIQRRTDDFFPRISCEMIADNISSVLCVFGNVQPSQVAMSVLNPFFYWLIFRLTGSWCAKESVQAY
jgi:hypothetical protein